MTGDNECCDLAEDLLREDLLREDLTAAAIELAVNGFAALWHAETPTRDALLPGRAEQADEVLIELVERGRAEVDADGVLIGVHGLTARPTRHRFVHAGRLHHTWCAFDSVGIPAAMSLDAVATSDCPTCGRQVTVELREGDAADEAVALWLPTPERNSDLMKDFCASADLYCSTDHLRQRVDVHRSHGRVVPLDEALALGRETWSDIAGATTVDKPQRRDDG